MHRFTVKQVSRIGSGTILLRLQPKSNRHKLDFQPGQYAAIGFKKGVRPSPMRCFSIVSSPNNPDELQFGIRVLGDYTTTLSELNPGDKVFVRGPFGEFVIDEYQDHRVVLIAGGIGITPFMSMIRYATETQLNIPITLLYSCKFQDDIPFREELIKYEQQNPRFKVVFFVTSGGIDKLQNSRALKGRITETHFTQLTKEQFNQFTYFVCGPKGFMNHVKKTLSDLGTYPDRIITEDFTASSPNNSLALLPKHSITKWTYGLTAASLVLASGFIMTIDLARAVPKLVSAENTQQQSVNTSNSAQVQNQQAATSTPSSTDNTAPQTSSSNAQATSPSSTQNSNTSSTSTATNTSTNSQPTVSSPPASQPVQSYKPPVTSVS